MAVVVMVPGWRQRILNAFRPYRNQLADEVANDVRRNIVSGGNVETGALLRSVESKRGRVYIGTDHWEHIEYGTGRHIIAPKPGGVLANPAKGFGPVRRAVMHPGNRAYAPVRRALYKKRPLKKRI